MGDEHFAAQIQELREESARSGQLDVITYGNEINSEFDTPAEEDPCERHALRCSSSKPPTGVRPNHNRHWRNTGSRAYAVTAHPSRRFRLSEQWLSTVVARPNPANRILKHLQFRRVAFPNEPAIAALFLANPALESLDMTDCTLCHSTFDSLCGGIQSSHIQELKISVRNLSPEVPLGPRCGQHWSTGPLASRVFVSISGFPAISPAISQPDLNPLSRTTPTFGPCLYTVFAEATTTLRFLSHWDEGSPSILLCRC